MYQHLDWDGKAINLPVGKVVCVGLNYVKHIVEMQQIQVTPPQAPTEPILFMKPAAALCRLTEPLQLPSGLGAVHHEVELAVLLQHDLKNASLDQVKTAIWGYAVALDLTLRAIQTQLKVQGLPWEKSKAFDNACPISGFLPTTAVPDPQQVKLQLSVNNQLRHNGTTAQMIFPVVELIAYMSQFFSLQAGDVILTGTPEGVGELLPGDKLLIQFQQQQLTTQVAA